MIYFGEIAFFPLNAGAFFWGGGFSEPNLIGAFFGAT